MLSIDAYKEIYTILDSAGPLSYDCGRLCDSACCNDSSFDGEDSYIYLLPGEKEYLDAVGSNITVERQKRAEHDLPRSWGEYVFIARCPGKKSCDRSIRPVQCRTFPLYPYITDKGVLEMTLCYMDLPYSCPFVEGKETVSADFWRATLKAWNMLIEDAAIRDLVILDSKEFIKGANKHESDIGNR